MTALEAAVPALRLEARVQARYGVFTVMAGLSVVVGVLLAVLAVWSPTAARTATPFVLLVDTATIGTVVAAALLLSGRSEGVLAAQVTAPPGARGLLLARIAVLLAATLAAAVLVATPALALGGDPLGVIPLLAGTALVATVLMVPAAALAARTRSLTGYLVATPLLLTPLLGIPLLHGVGLVNHSALQVVPTVPALDLLRVSVGTGPAPQASAVLWSVAATAAVAVPSLHLAERRVVDGPPPERSRRRRQTALPHNGSERSGSSSTGAWHAVTGYLRTDIRLVCRDAVLVIVLASPLLLGAVLRWGYPPTEHWVATRYGVDLTAHRPVLALLLVVLHVPFTTGMVGGLLVLDDRDDRVLLALAVSPLTLTRYLTYRCTAVTTLAALGLAVALPLSDLVPMTVDTVGALLGAALIAPTVTLAVAGLARGRVEGVLIVKALGIPLYLPITVALLTGPSAAAVTAALGWLPSTWVVVAFQASQDGGPWGWPAITLGLVVTAGLCRVLGRRALRPAIG